MALKRHWAVTYAKVKPMPYHVAKSSKCPSSKPWAVIKNSDGSVMGCHPTKAKANAQLKALYANEPSAKAEDYTVQRLQSCPAIELRNTSYDPDSRRTAAAQAGRHQR